MHTRSYVENPLSFEESVAMLHDIIKGRENFVYQGNCAYFSEGEDGELEPSCIIGHVLHRMGYLGTVERRFNFYSMDCVPTFRNLFSPEAFRFLCAVQAAQDGRDYGTWENYCSELRLGDRMAWADAVRYGIFSVT